MKMKLCKLYFKAIQLIEGFNAQLYVFILMFLLSMSCYSTDYFCPQTPESFRVGDTISGNWFVWMESEEVNDIKKEYYKNHTVKYKINRWSSFLTGVRKGNFKGLGNFIGCCYFFNAKDGSLCVYKQIAQKNCKANVFRRKRKKFSCANKGF